VKHIVALHNGEVAITSAGENRGTRVTVGLPIVCRPVADTTRLTTTKLTPRRILLVDDSVDATEALGTLLALEGHDVRQANSGESALAMVESFIPEVALIDIAMRGMNGLQLARLLRRNQSLTGMTLVALTGHAGESDKSESAGAGFDHHLVKPVSLEQLFAIFSDRT
jgi:CheY-like chemotaxis protein